MKVLFQKRVQSTLEWQVLVVTPKLAGEGLSGQHHRVGVCRNRKWAEGAFSVPKTGGRVQLLPCRTRLAL